MTAAVEPAAVGPWVANDPTVMADRLTLALTPRHRVLAVSSTLHRFAAEVAAEAGTDVLRTIVSTIERHRPLTGPWSA